MEREIARLRRLADGLQTGNSAGRDVWLEQCDAVERAAAEASEKLQRLAESEALYRALAETSPEAIFIADLNGVVVKANHRAAEIFGASSAGALAGISAMTLLFADGAPPPGDFWPQLLATGMVQGSEIELTRLDGTRLAADWSLSLTPDTGAGARFLAATVRPAAPRKPAEEPSGERLPRDGVRRFAGGVAHEFNNLLTIVRGHSELLLRRLPADDGRSRKVRQIVKAADRARDLVNHLLAFSRQPVAETETVEVNRALRELEAAVRDTLGAGVDLRMDLDKAADSVRIDSVHFARMLMNLVAHSRDAVRGAGAVTVRSRLAAPYVTISLTDTGAGLGLAAVYGSVEQAGGYVTVQALPGQGTTVSIHLPVYTAAESRP